MGSDSEKSVKQPDKDADTPLQDDSPTVKFDHITSKGTLELEVDQKLNFLFRTASFNDRNFNQSRRKP